MKQIIRMTAAMMCLCVLLSMVVVGNVSAEKNTEYAAGGYEKIAETAAVSLHFTSDNGEGVRLNAGEKLSASAEITAAGKYYLVADYMAKDSRMTDNTVEITLGDIVTVGYLPEIWKDATKDYELDYRGNELIPEQQEIELNQRRIIRDYADIGLGLLELELGMGDVSISVKSLNRDNVISALKLVPVNGIISYSEYKSNYSDEKVYSKLELVEGEAYVSKTKSHIKSDAIKNSALYPYSSSNKLINVLDGQSWSSAGQQVSWKINVPQSGLYSISLRYAQYSDTDKPSWRSVMIDGEYPFEEAKAIAFKPTPSNNDFENHTLGGTTPYLFYLEQGEHILTLTVTLGPLYDIYTELKVVIDEIDAVGMDLIRLTAGVTDSNRTWDMEKTLPEVIPTLENCIQQINTIYKDISDILGEEPDFASDLRYAVQLLEKVLERPKKLPSNIDMISSGDNSASKYLSLTLSKLLSNPLSVDRFYLGDPENELPQSKAGFIKSLWEGILGFLRSFTDSYGNSYAADISGKKDQLEVWVSRSVQYIDVMQRLVDRMYNQQYGTRIKLSIMPSEQKLVLANAAGTIPDLAIGVAGGTPFNLAVRGAAQDLTEFDDFLEFYTSQYSPANLTTAGFNGGVYGATETMGFTVLFYRTDIIEALELEIPDTWDDVKNILPTLLRYKMNMFIPLSASGGYKGYGATMPFLYQNGAKLFSSDGASVALDSEQAYKGINEMIKLYTIYGMQQAVPDVYNSFRYGEIPLATGGLDLYLKLSVAAPELSGKWDIALVPGTVSDNGEVLRYQPAAATSCMIFKRSDHKQEAWQFLKWWLDADTQLEYAYQMTETYGTEFFWCTANLKAFEELPLISAEHKKIILEQLTHQMETPCHPANYIVERELSNIWIDVVVNGQTLSDNIDSAVTVMNREIVRKLETFDYVDSRGNVLEPFEPYYYDEQ